MSKENQKNETEEAQKVKAEANAENDTLKDGQAAEEQAAEKAAPVLYLSHHRRQPINILSIIRNIFSGKSMNRF